MARWTWVADMDDLVGSVVRLETLDGIRREGIASRVHYHQLVIDGRKIRYPTSIELNTDSGDIIDLPRIIWLETE